MRSTAVLLAALLAPAAVAQQPVPAPGSPAPAAQAAPRFDDPYEAYDAGSWDQALEGFLDLQVERPEDPEVALNVGSAHFQMRSWGEAQKAFSRALVSGRPEVRERALYNLGNTAYRQGRLGEAVELYKAALEIDPDDEDAKFNLEFVRDEIRRRHEEAKKRQENQENQENQGQQEQQQQEQDGRQQQDAGEQDSGEPGAPPEERPDPDRDGDGLPDETETSGDNPTDPDNPDSDGDGLPDGAEDANRSGGVDPGETDPNLADSDGDGVPDGEDPEPAAASGAAEAAAEPEESLTPEEAMRYLQALEEARPGQQRAVPGRSRRPAKDW